MNVFVFRPGGVQSGNVFNDWTTLVDALATVEGRKIIEFDDSLVSPNPCVIPAVPQGRTSWEMKDVSWAGFGPRPGIVRPKVDILEGAVFTGLRIIGGQITITNSATHTPPISDFLARDHVHIGLRDDAGNTELINAGAAPLFHIAADGVLFFVQNSLMGVAATSIHPLIRYTATNRPLGLNLLGQNQTGNNLVEAGPNAKVLFGALSPAAQVGADQGSTTLNGEVRFGPVGRIQRQVLPLPPLTPATSALVPDPLRQFFTLPNVVLRCDGRAPGFTQPLPRIIGGFTMGLAGAVAVYSGGQEVVVAEISGGIGLNVCPDPHDTIDGFPGPVSIGAHESKTFVSDGVSNWMTTVTAKASLGMETLKSVTAVFETADEEGAGTNGDVYLGIGGREFRCDSPGSEFESGGTDTFVFGDGANVHHADRNDPRAPQLTLDDVDRCPTYVRFVEGGQGAWKVLRVSVHLSVSLTPHPLHFRSDVHDAGGLWLGSDSGAMLFLRRSLEP
jgi:hypothetical protein